MMGRFLAVMENKKVLSVLLNIWRISRAYSVYFTLFMIVVACILDHFPRPA
jgi:hypothetical protein